jgi:hypothetical protein
MMVYRKGELSSTDIDRNWPHQVVLSARACEGTGYDDIHEFCKDLTLCSRGHSVCDGGEWFHVYCFADPAHAEKFKQRFGGEKFDPSQRGRGKSWARWKRPQTS